MTFSNRGSFGGNKGRSFGKRGGEDRGFDKPLYDAVCAKCGISCQVPFRPNGRKEVLCNTCFRPGDSDNSRGGSRYGKKDSFRSNFEEKRMFSAVCDECGENCQVPFQPRGDKPVLCSRCFGKEDRGGRSSSFGGYSKLPKVESINLDEVNEKLDKILKLLSPKKVKKESKS